MKRLLLLLMVAVGFAACTADDYAPTGSLNVAFTHWVNGLPLSLTTGTYQNSAGESFTVTKFDYFISNIRLLRADGSAYTVPQDDSYFLIRSSDAASRQFRLRNIPEGTYTQIEFMVGVDSLRNTADVGRRTGVLDPGGSHTGEASPGGMYWDWNTGYIHLKLEGTSPSAPVDATGARNFRYHIGLFGGYQSRTLNNLRTVRVPMGTAGTVPDAGAASIVIKADVGRMFDGPTPIRIAQYPDVMISPISATIANNYATLFSRYD